MVGAIAVALSLIASVLVVAIVRDRQREVIADPPVVQVGDPWPAGTWQSRFTVDLPAQWSMDGVQIRVHSSETFLVGPPDSLGAPAGPTRGCRLIANAPGEPMTVPTDAKPVQVGGAAGHYRPRPAKSGGGTYGLFWPDGLSGWAQLDCDDLSERATLALADRVTFTMSTVRVPVRLTRVPGGYRRGSLMIRDPAESPFITLDAIGPSEVPTLSVWLTTSAARPETPQEKISLGGRPARLWAFHRQLCFEGERAVCVSELATDPMGNDRQRWPDGVREALIATAQSVVAAADPDDQSTWFEGRSAFPA